MLKCGFSFHFRTTVSTLHSIDLRHVGGKDSIFSDLCRWIHPVAMRGLGIVEKQERFQSLESKIVLKQTL